LNPPAYREPMKMWESAASWAWMVR